MSLRYFCTVGCEKIWPDLKRVPRNSRLSFKNCFAWQINVLLSQSFNLFSRSYCLLNWKDSSSCLAWQCRIVATVDCGSVNWLPIYLSRLLFLCNVIVAVTFFDQCSRLKILRTENIITIEVVVVIKCKIEVLKKEFVCSINRIVRWLHSPDFHLSFRFFYLFLSYIFP